MDDRPVAMDANRDEHNVPDKLISTSVSSYNESTTSLKRVLLDTSVDRVDLKKMKFSDNSDEEQVISLNTKENHINLTVEKTPDQISETTENNSEEHSNVSYDMRIDSNSEKNNSIYDKDVDNLNTNCGKDIIEQDGFITEDESTGLNTSFKSFHSEFIKTGNCEFVQDNSNIYENKSLSDNLVTVEKSYANINENSLLTEISLNEENAKDLEEIVNIENKKTDDIHFTNNDDTVIKEIDNDFTNNDDTVVKEMDNDFTNNDDTVLKEIDNEFINNDDTVVKEIDNEFINNDVGTTEKDNTSDIEDKAQIDNFFKSTQELTKANFPIFMKMFSSKNVDFEHFETTCLKIISLYFSKKIKEQIDVKLNEILDVDKYWHSKYISLNRKLEELAKVTFKMDNINVQSQQIKKTVGIQVDMHNTDQKHRFCVSEVDKPSQKPINTPIQNIVKLTNDDDDSSIINNDVEHMINNNRVQHDISNNYARHIVNNDPIVISDDDDENIFTLNTQLSNAMEKNITVKKELTNSNTSEESSDFLSTTVPDYNNLPNISLRINPNIYPIIDLTEVDNDDSNNENSTMLQNRNTIDQTLYTQRTIPSGQPILHTNTLGTVQLPPNNSGQHQQQSSGAVQNVPMKFLRWQDGNNEFIPVNNFPNCPQQILEINASPNCVQQLRELGGPPSGPQQYVMSNCPQSGSQQYAMSNGPRSGSQQYVMLNDPPRGPQQYVRPSGLRQYVRPSGVRQWQYVRPSGPQQYVMPNGPQQYVKPNVPSNGLWRYLNPNAHQTGPSQRYNVSQICQPSTSAATVQSTLVSQYRTLQSSSRPVLNKHPAPLPIAKNQRSGPLWKKLPNAPIMHFPFTVTPGGFTIKWNTVMGPYTAAIKSYQFYVYDESTSPPEPTTETWVEIGKVKALKLPMACSFSLSKRSRYYLSMRAIDEYDRYSPFCAPKLLDFLI